MVYTHYYDAPAVARQRQREAAEKLRDRHGLTSILHDHGHREECNDECEVIGD